MKDSEKTSHSYDVTGPDKDGELGVEWDVDSNIIWLSRPDVERMLARFEEHKVTGGKRWIAVKDAPAKPEPVVSSAMLLDCEGCWTHSIPIEECDGDRCPLCGSPALVEHDEQFDAAVWGGGRNREYGHPAPEVSASATVGEPVKPIEPLSLLAGTGIVEVIRKINEIIERLNGKGGV